ncbi:MAG: sigma factor-like helix-turn-helix DNA-binding protein, partial [Patescibacteria group bacterium]
MIFPYQKLTSALVSDLDPRVRDILTRRFGLRAEESETLEAIGQSHGITRERVRQIVEAGVEQVRQEAAQKKEQEKLQA